MRHPLPVLTLAAVLSSLGASAAHALDMPPLCKALHSLADDARQSGLPQRISVAGACRAESPASRAFCDAAGGGDPDALPWQIRGCVETMAADPQISFGGPHPGIPHDKRITHLAAKLGHGLRLDVSARAGGYDVVVWQVK